jgi:hypothetical protein
MPILRGKPSQRPERFALNTGSPLARGLVFAGLGQHAGGTLYHDDSTSKKHGTLTGFTGAGNTPAARWVWANPISRPALTFNASTNYVTFPTLGIFGNTQSYSVSCWVSCASVGGYQTIWHCRAERDVYLRHDGAAALQWAYYDGSSKGPTVSALVANVWTHLCGVFDKSANQVVLYRDGVSVGTPATPGTPSARSDLNTLGTAYYGGTTNNGFPGSISDVLVHGRALSREEAASLADPSNVDLRLGGVPLIQPVRRFWPVVGAADSGSTASGVGASAGVGAASGVGASLAASAGASAGVGAASGVGSSLYAGAGSSSGVATVSATGSSLFKGVGASAGVATVAATGSSLFAGAGVSAGIGSASGTGASLYAGVGTASGVGAASGVGSALSVGVGSSAGVAVVSAAGASLFSGVGSAAGVGAASGVGASTSAGSGVGSAAGSATVAGVGSALFAGVGTSAGIGSVAGVGSSLFAAVGSAAGVAVATGVGASEAGGTGVGSAAGSCVVVGVGAALAAGVGTASGVATVLGSSAPVSLYDVSIVLPLIRNASVFLKTVRSAQVSLPMRRLNGA